MTGGPTIKWLKNAPFHWPFWWFTPLKTNMTMQKDTIHHRYILHENAKKKHHYITTDTSSNGYFSSNVMLVFGGVPATMVSWVESVLPENSGFIRIPVCWCCDKSWCLVDVGFLDCRGVVENSRTFRMTIQWVSEIEIVRLFGMKPPTSYILSFLVLSNNRFGQWTIDRFDSQRVVHIFKYELDLHPTQDATVA